MFGDFEKAMTWQEIKVKCIKDNEEFHDGGEYESTYFPPDIFIHHSFFVVRNKCSITYDWDDFFKNFVVLTEDFEGIPYIELEFK